MLLNPKLPPWPRFLSPCLYSGAEHVHGDPTAPPSGFPGPHCQGTQALRPRFFQTRSSKSPDWFSDLGGCQTYLGTRWGHEARPYLASVSLEHALYQQFRVLWCHGPWGCHVLQSYHRRAHLAPVPPLVTLILTTGPGGDRLTHRCQVLCAPVLLSSSCPDSSGPSPRLSILSYFSNHFLHLKKRKRKIMLIIVWFITIKK